MAQVLTPDKALEKRHSVPRRSPFETRMDVLTVVTTGCTRPTQIMYKSNTSWIVLQKILESLTASGLLRQRVERSRTEYVATDKGIDVAREYLDLVRATNAEPTSVF